MKPNPTCRRRPPTKQMSSWAPSVTKLGRTGTSNTAVVPPSHAHSPLASALSRCASTSIHGCQVELLGSFANPPFQLKLAKLPSLHVGHPDAPRAVWQLTHDPSPGPEAARWGLASPPSATHPSLFCIVGSAMASTTLAGTPRGPHSVRGNAALSSQSRADATIRSWRLLVPNVRGVTDFRCT